VEVHDRGPGAAAQAPEVNTRTIGRAVSWVGLGHLVSQGTWFVSLLVLAAFVPPQAFGAVSAALVITSAATLVIGSGTRGAIITSRDLTVEHLRYALALNVGLGVLLTALVGLFAGPVMLLVLPEGDPEVLRWLLVGVGMHALAVVPLALLEKQMLFKRVAAVWAVSAVVASLLAGAAGALGAEVWALVIRQVAFSVLLTLGALVAARRLLPPPSRLLGSLRRPREGRGATATLFFVMSVFWEIKLWADNVVVGRLTGPTQLGLYSLAFTLGFAPLTHVAWKLGDVLLPAAAATPAPDVVARRAIRAMRIVGLVLVPLVIPAIVLAPWLVPLLLGERWAPMVVPFQILLPVGVAQALIHVIAESLSGSGNIDLHARLQGVWALVLIPTLIVLVGAEGIRGAALAQLLVLLPLGTAYLVLGARRLGVAAGDLARPLAGFLAPVAAQLALTLAVVAALGATSAPEGAVLGAGTLAGIGAMAAVLLLTRSPVLGDARSVVASVAGRA